MNERIAFVWYDREQYQSVHVVLLRISSCSILLSVDPDCGDVVF